MQKLFALFTILMIITVSGCISNNDIKCPDDTRICPDGIIVSRIAPDCEFEKCPVVQNNSEELQDTIEEAKIIYVSILRNEFDPDQINASVGTTIIWTNDDTKTHAIGGAKFGGSSGTLKPGESWNYTIKIAQKYEFYDMFYFFQGEIIGD